MKIMIISLFTLLASHTAASNAESVHGFSMTDIHGKSVSLDDYKGKVILMVNTASKCGYTKQYAGLVQLQKTYKDQGLVVMGFPANNFMGQEPGTNREIAQFCSDTFGVDFPMFAKLSVKGSDQHPLFAYLTSADNPDFTGKIRWNFEKFLIGPDGKLLRRFRSKAKPTDDRMKKAVEQAIALTE